MNTEEIIMDDYAYVEAIKQISLLCGYICCSMTQINLKGSL